MRIVLLICFTLLFQAPTAWGQIDGLDSSPAVKKEHLRAKSFYFTWGYNRSHYQDTDIRFKGDDFDFTFIGVKGQDVPKSFDADVYLNPLKFTIPQFDFRLGYNVTERWSISLGWDHMKYHVIDYQRITLDGTVSESFSPFNEGVYDNASFDLTPGFVRFEHTDGLNFIRLEAGYQLPIWENESGLLHLDFMLAGSFGPVATWTDSTIDGIRYRNWLRISGYGVSAQGALRFGIGNVFFLQYQHQNGYINLPSIVFMDESPNRASHDIFFNEQSISFGCQLPIYVGGNPNK